MYVGFSLSSVSFNESSTSSSITITRTNPIGSDLTLTITGGKQELNCYNVCSNKVSSVFFYIR